MSYRPPVAGPPFIHLDKSTSTYAPGKYVVEEGDLCLNAPRQAEAFVEGVVRGNHKIRQVLLLWQHRLKGH